MVESREIAALWRRQRGGVLVTLVHAEGSSYRRAGARLLATPALAAAGTISGGCLEAEVVRRAQWLVREGAVVERYSTAFDDAQEIPFGLGCGGTVDLLFEQADAPEATALLEAMEAALAGRAATVVSFLPGEGRGLRRLILDDRGELLFASATLSAEKIACARGLDPGKVYAGRFVERLEVPQRLMIFGAGEDAKPVASLALQLGWSVTVADGRPNLARADRFSAGVAVMTLDLADPSKILRSLALRASDAVVLMTHSYEQDRLLLTELLRQPPRYLGLLGARHRSSLLLTEAAECLHTSVAACVELVYAPVGLNLGGDGPQAIALSIVAEVQAVLHGKASNPGRLGVTEIAALVAREDSTRYLQSQCSTVSPL